ncbi:hypothetical protein A1QO_06275 [Vibrio genomosp. F10 str. ZF-129]|uniref:Uncharacterized protein n=2 Tax=Vibrio genomosp. F10 TaxID=723171 RepID=A0A1E5BGD8_9VIBR|nr:hypothetical protein A1QO_06275 [Vibrio genomosp. F10 str. ZF-129]
MCGSLVDLLGSDYKSIEKFCPLAVGIDDELSILVAKLGFSPKQTQSIIDQHFRSIEYASSIINAPEGAPRYELNGEVSSSVVEIWHRTPYLDFLFKDACSTAQLNKSGLTRYRAYEKSIMKQQFDKDNRARILLRYGYNDQSIIKNAGTIALRNVNASKSKFVPCYPTPQRLMESESYRENYQSLTSKQKKSFIDSVIDSNHARCMELITGYDQERLGAILLNKLIMT